MILALIVLAAVIFFTGIMVGASLILAFIKKVPDDDLEGI